MLKNNTINQALVTQLIHIAREAGAAIVAIYSASEKIVVQVKADNSPVTAADIAANNIIVPALEKLLVIPIISEETALPHFDERKNWQAYWLIDPLDGTKEFIARTGEFTVNIALIKHGMPVLGVVHVPVTDETYVGVVAVSGKNRAEKYHQGIKISDLTTRNLTARFVAKETLGVLASARHGNAETAELMHKVSHYWPAPVELLNVGSSLKFCWIAEGRADFYPRLAPTCEWDTAAAQAVLVAAGGAVVNAKNLVSLRCNQAESLLNPSFFALGDAGFAWAEILSDALC
jgi:3'(2'), 5'-bisphosphate nucleotidase